MPDPSLPVSRWFSRTAQAAAEQSGRAWAFVAASGIVLAWIVSGPAFGWSDTWQLVINTGTTIITFLMVFLLQHTQNRDTVAIQLKLDELIRASSASNALRNIEALSEEELQALRKRLSSKVRR